MRPSVLITLLAVSVLALCMQANASFARVAGSEYEETPVEIVVQRQGSVVVPALLKDDSLFLPIFEVFQYLGIKAEPARDGQSISGFFIDEYNSYSVNAQTNEIFVNRRTTSSQGILVSNSRIFLASTEWGKTFDLHMRFNFRALEVELTTNLELPIVREMLREQARRAMLRTEDRIKADKYAPLDRSILNGAMLDWAISSQLLPRYERFNYSLGAGIEFLGGDLTASAVGVSDQPLTLVNTPIKWRYVLPESRIVSQVVAGNDIQFPGTVALPYATGVHITNTPVTFRQGFSSYVVRDYTEPNWMVELFVNERLVDYARADAAGYFQFSTPLPYGTTNIKLKFYGPFGEERTREKLVQVPYTFVPPGEIEYGLIAARLYDTNRTYYGSVGAQFGVTSWLTVGGGSYYFRDSTREPLAPVGSMSLRIADQLLVNAAYIHGFESKAHLTYSLPSGLNADLSLVKFAKEQRFFSRTVLEERRLAIGLPIPFGLLPGALRLSATQSISEANNDYFAEAGITTFILNTPVTYLTSAQYQRKPLNELLNMRSNLSVLFRMPYELLLRPETEFDHKQTRLNTFRATLERHLSSYGWVTLGFERNVPLKTNTFKLDLRLDLTGAQIFTNASRSTEWSITQGARGALGVDGSFRPVLDNRTMLGRGGLMVRPFLDKNHNSIREDDEPLLKNLDLQISTGRIISGPNTEVIRITDLEPFYPVVLKTSGINFENIAWRSKYPTYLVQVEPNQFKTVDIPIYIAGEVMGQVTRPNGAGAAGIKIYFKNKETSIVDSVTTIAGGDYDLLALVPGEYEAYIDPAQLAQMNMRAEPAMKTFIVRSKEEGDVIENVNFKLIAL
jgi:hypothetical protein